MKFRGSHLFYLFVLTLVGAVYYFDYYRGEESQKKKEQDSILVPFLKADVTKVEAKNASGEMELVKSDQGWELKKPVADLASADETDGWIQSLTTEKSVEKIGEGEVFDWATYGLDKPKGSIVVTSRSGTKIELEISAKKNFEGNPFIRKNGEKIVYVGSSVWSSLMEKTSQQLREKKILRKTLAELESISIFKGTSELRLNLEKGKWLAPSQPQWNLDQNKVRELVNVLQGMQATEYVLENEPDSKTAVQFGLKPPALKVQFTLKGGEPWVSEFGQNKDKVWYAWPKSLKKVVKVEASQVEKFTKAALSDLRDRELPFQFNKEDVKKLRISDPKPLELSKEGDQWKGSSPGVVEGNEVNQLLERIRQLRVAEFLDGKVSVTGLDDSSKQFVLADTQGKNLLELKIGKSFKKKEDKVEKTYYYAKSSIYPDVISLKEEDVKNLAADKLIKAETKAESKPTSEGAMMESPKTEIENK